MKTEHNPNWGGKRPNSGRPSKYVKVEKKYYTERSEREQIPESDLTICLAEAYPDENITDRGIVIDEIWYDANEVMAIARYIEEHRPWLQGSK